MNPFRTYLPAFIVAFMALAAWDAATADRVRSNYVRVGPDCVFLEDGPRLFCLGPFAWRVEFVGDRTQVPIIARGPTGWSLEDDIARYTAQIISDGPVAAAYAVADEREGFITPSATVQWIVGEEGRLGLSFSARFSEIDTGGTGGEMQILHRRIVVALDPAQGPCLVAILSDEDRYGPVIQGERLVWPSDADLSLDLALNADACWAAAD